jgi:hypothetical protein
VTWCCFWPSQSLSHYNSIRHFRWEALPPLQHHNKDLTVKVNVLEGKENMGKDPTVTVGRKDGHVEVIGEYFVCD